MKYMLSVANFTNAGTSKGDAYGFKCKSLYRYSSNSSNKLSIIGNIL